MNFQAFNAVEGRPRRQENKVVVYLSPQQPVPDMVPYELHEHISPGDWHTRIMTIRDVSFQFYKPMLERLWFMIATLTVIVLPLVLYQVIVNILYDNNATRKRQDEQILEARWISFGIFIGTLAFFFMPMVIWKTIGAIRIKRRLAGWERADRAARAPNAFVPVWTVQTPTVFKSTCIVSITVPPNTKPTIFHPDAYLPPYINQARNDAYFYPYGTGGQGGLPRMSTVGTLPGYQAEPGKEHYFEDVKLAQA